MLTQRKTFLSGSSQELEIRLVLLNKLRTFKLKILREYCNRILQEVLITVVLNKTH